jgi:hypothetical protein
MSVFKESLNFDDFADEVSNYRRDLETEIWCYGLPGLIAMIRAFVKIGYNDHPRLVDVIHGLSGNFDFLFIDAFIDHLTGDLPDIHILHKNDEGKLVLIETTNL